MNASAVDKLFDALGKLSDATVQADRLRRLEAELRSVGTTCGDCSLWMTRQCPREANVNGRNKGPSCEAPRGSVFSESPSAERRRESLRRQLQEERG